MEQGAGRTFVLVVDDDEDARGLVRGVLEEMGCVVREAENGRAALAYLDAILPDLIVLDLEMPVMNGWQFYRHLQHNPKLAAIPVAVLSAYGGDAPSGPCTVLRKPLNLDKIVGLLNATELAAEEGKLERLLGRESRKLRAVR